MSSRNEERRLCPLCWERVLHGPLKLLAYAPNLFFGGVKSSHSVSVGHPASACCFGDRTGAKDVGGGFVPGRGAAGGFAADRLAGSGCFLDFLNVVIEKPPLETRGYCAVGNLFEIVAFVHRKSCHKRSNQTGSNRLWDRTQSTAETVRCSACCCRIRRMNQRNSRLCPAPRETSGYR